MTDLTLVFGLALLAAVLTSELAAHSPLSTSTVFLLGGLVAGPLALDLVEASADQAERAAEISLFAILFTDGQHAPWGVLRRAWRAPVRTLVIAMPLTLLAVAGIAHWVTGVPWPAALVLGAVLAPTDPVFASALVGRDDVPRPVREVLNIESGLNDGLALPAVLVLAGLAGGDPAAWSTDPGVLVLEVVVGCALGVLLPVAIAPLLRLPGVGADRRLQPLGPFAVAITLYGCCAALHANQFIAAFVAGSTVATLRPSASDAFRRTGELVSELAKGGALLAFATLVDPSIFQTAGALGLVFAAGVLLVARPAAVAVALVGAAMSGRERAAVAWFGPKGFASVAYAVIVLGTGMDSAGDVFALTTVTVLVSVVAHSSTDVAVSRWLASRASPAG